MSSSTNNGPTMLPGNWNDLSQSERFKQLESFTLPYLQTLGSHSMLMKETILCWVQTKEGLKTLKNKLEIQEEVNREEIKAKFLTLAVFMIGLTKHLEMTTKVKILNTILKQMSCVFTVPTIAAGASKFINVFTGNWKAADLTLLIQEFNYKDILQDTDNLEAKFRGMFRGIFLDGAEWERKVFWLKTIIDTHSKGDEEAAARLIFTLYGPVNDTGSIKWECPEEDQEDLDVVARELRELAVLVHNIDSNHNHLVSPSLDQVIHKLLAILKRNWGTLAVEAFVSQAGCRAMEIQMKMTLVSRGEDELATAIGRLARVLIVLQSDGEAFGTAIGKALHSIDDENRMMAAMDKIVKVLTVIVGERGGNIPRHMFEMFVKMSCKWTTEMILKILHK